MRTALICDRDIRIREKLKQHLMLLGFEDIRTCNQRDNALELAMDHRPQLVLLEAASPMAGLELTMDIRQHYMPLIILLVGLDDQLPDNQAAAGQVDAFLAKQLPLGDTELPTRLALHTAQQVAKLRQELNATQLTLQQRKTIERAKGIVMELESLSEEQAYRWMRSQAMTRRVSMAALAEKVISSATKDR